MRLNFHATLFEISASQTFFSPAHGPPIEEPCSRASLHKHYIKAVVCFSHLLKPSKQSKTDKGCDKTGLYVQA